MISDKSSVSSNDSVYKEEQVFISDNLYFERNTNKAEAAKEKKAFMKEFYRTTDTLELDKNYKVSFNS